VRHHALLVVALAALVAGRGPEAAGLLAGWAVADALVVGQWE
jgi:hypothetical protein